MFRRAVLDAGILGILLPILKVEFRRSSDVFYPNRGTPETHGSVSNLELLHSIREEGLDGFLRSGDKNAAYRERMLLLAFDVLLPKSSVSDEAIRESVNVGREDSRLYLID